MAKLKLTLQIIFLFFVHILLYKIPSSRYKRNIENNQKKPNIVLITTTDFVYLIYNYILLIIKYYRVGMILVNMDLL